MLALAVLGHKMVETFGMFCPSKWLTVGVGLRNQHDKEMEMKWSAMAVLIAGLTVAGGVAAEEAEPKAPEAIQYGGSFELKDIIAVDTVVANPEKFAGKTILVKGKITSVCKKKGCWLQLGNTSTPEKLVRVRMKDYGFFVPLDCDGQTAVIEGVFSRKVLQEKMVKHYEEDAGKDPSKVSGTREELSLLANGISILPR